MAKTHQNFKSFVLEITDINDLINSLPLTHLDKVHNERIVDEKDKWKNGEWEKISLDVENIDRVYYHDFTVNEYDKNWWLIGRMQYKGQPMYIELHMWCIEKFENDGGGTLLLGKDKDLFLKKIYITDEEIYKFLGDE